MQSNILLVYYLYILLNPAKQSIMIWAQEQFYMYAHVYLYFAVDLSFYYDSSPGI